MISVTGTGSDRDRRPRLACAGGVSEARQLPVFKFPNSVFKPELTGCLTGTPGGRASHAGGPAVEEPGRRPFKLRPRAGPLAVGAAAEPSARRTRSSGSSLSSLSRTQASVPSLRARLRLGCQPEPGPAARGATGSLSDCSSWSCAACAAATPSDGTVLPQAARAGAAVRGRRGRGNRDRAAAGNLNSASCPSDAVRSIHKGRWCFTIRFTKRLNYEF